jgi:hypothetical protein
MHQISVDIPNNLIAIFTAAAYTRAEIDDVLICYIPGPITLQTPEVWAIIRDNVTTVREAITLMCY